MTSTWPGLIGALLAGQDLDRSAAEWAMSQVMSGEASPAQIAGFLVGLRAKGETSAEVAGMADAMLSHARPLTVPGPAVDTCGTGGDRAHTVNVSTMAALVAAGAGVTVVKHGNRAASSACGSADLLEELGVAVDLEPAAVAACIAETGIGFCFAPVFHPAMRHAAVPRRELGVATAFNVLGPLCNPARPVAQAVGCADPRLAPVMAGVLAARGTRGLVFRGDDGLDELTTASTSTAWLVADGEVSQQTLDPAELGIARTTADGLRGGDAALNASITKAFLGGEPGPVRDAVLLNAAAALLALEGPRHGHPLAAQLRDPLSRATAAVDGGAAAELLGQWVRVSQDRRAG
ncbi:MAG: anthranilate phosphoribosyltransferase [Frankiales bacterium]|nr:anthranilate phosphoribosyltransferase [Frankiales bacterium]